MITINKPITIAETQTFEINQIKIDFIAGTISVLTNIKNEDGGIVGTISDEYSGQEAIDYWANFSSKQFAYEKMVDKNSIDVVVENVPDILVEVVGQ